MCPQRLVSMLTFLRRRGDFELAERLDAIVVLLLWAQLAAASGRNDHRPHHWRAKPGARTLISLRRARRSTAGRRARG